jgi:inorganic pyrophosphatase
VSSRRDLPPHFLLEVEHFFLTYKDLERKSVQSDGWGGKDEAQAFIRDCIAAARPGGHGQAAPQRSAPPARRKNAKG